MNSLWWLPEFPPNQGGIGTFASLVAPALAARGNVTTLLVCQGESSGDILDGVRIVREPVRTAFERAEPASIVRMRRKIVALKNEVAADLYHLHITDPTPIIHLSTLSEAPAPTITTLHNEMLQQFPTDDRESLMARVLDESRIIVCCSGSSALLNAGASPRFATKVVAIPNGIAIDRGPLPLPDNPTLLAIGRLVEQKGFHRAIEAMPHVLEARPDTHLRILGEGPERARLESLVDELGVRDSVSLPGHVHHSTMVEEFTRAQVVVAPSVHEGLPYALLEAASYGRPIVGTNVGGIRDVVTHGVNGVLVEPDAADHDPSVLADSVLSILNSNELARSYAAAGRRHIERHLSLEKCVERYEHVYRAAVQEPHDVAIIVPAYNAARHLAASLDSILHDVAHPEHHDLTFQILVVDDGSTDSTQEIAKSYAHHGIEVFSQPNLGGPMARNAGLALTRSEFVAHFDADDLWEPGRLAALLAPFRAQHGDDLDATFGLAIEFADDDAPANATVTAEPRLARMPTVGLLRRTAHQTHGGFTTNDHNDQFGWASLALAKGLRHTNVASVVIRRRIHGTNTSHRFAFTTDTSRVAVVKQALEARRSATRQDASSDIADHA
ncbi:MAG: glycogen(starch) synthase [Candidatus Azotimanducaceae bacterium]